MGNLFVRSGRLRSGWRLLSYILVSKILVVGIAVAAGFGIVLYLTLTGVPPSQLAARAGQMLPTLERSFLFLGGIELAQLAITAALVYIWRHWLDKQSFRSLGFQLSPGWWLEFLLGMGIVALTWLVIFAGALVTSAVAIQGLRLDFGSIVGGLGLGLFYNVLVGFYEELDARGYVLQTLAEGIHFWPALIISSLYFGALHLLNPGVNLGTIVGTALFGVLAGLAWWATGRLWMPIGMHAAWNWFEGPVFGFLVSGINMGGLFELKVTGPDWLTGGTFGPESGLLTLIPLVILIVIVYVWGQRRRTRQGAA